MIHTEQKKFYDAYTLFIKKNEKILMWQRCFFFSVSKKNNQKLIRKKKTIIFFF